MKEKLKVLSKKWWFWLIIVVVVCSLFSTPTDEKETPKDDNKVQETEKVKYLKGTNADDYADILESVTEIDKIEGTVNGTSIKYSKANFKYSVTLSANSETKEIEYVKIEALTKEDSTNVFMSMNRMDYETENIGEFTSWLVDNLGKESTKKIGDANFTLSLSDSNYPVIEMKTDGYNN